MKYYIRKIEQTKKEESGTITYNEYASVDKQNDYQSALSKFYDALSAAAKSAAHTYMNISLFNSNGSVLKDDIVGTYIDPDIEPEHEE